jgi:aryl-alcohol dehydrogenase-like predicted oxidoreductase
VASFLEWVRDEDEEASLLEACLAHVRSLPWATHVVVGVTSGEELAEICRAWELCGEESVPVEFGSSDLELIDPRRW